MKFNDDMIKRRKLPKDVFQVLHDLCYHHEGRDVQDYMLRAQVILASPRALKGHELFQAVQVAKQAP